MYGYRSGVLWFCVAAVVAGGTARAEELSDLEKAYLGWTKSAEEIQARERDPGDREQLRREAEQWGESILQGGSPTVAPKPQKHTPKCMYGANGEVIHAPPGADCGSPGHRAQAPTADEFVAPRADPNAGWAPVRAGEEALYTLVAHREASQGGTPVESLTLRGTQHVAVLGEPGGPFEVLATSRLRRGEGELEEIERESMIVLPHGGSHRIHAMRANFTGSDETVQLRAPVDLLPPRIARGVRWKAGEFSLRGLRYREEGEIFGLQDAVTPAGTYAQCLVVKHTGTMDGRIAASGMVLEVAQGRVERTQWLARGIGPVLLKQQVHLTLVTSDGDRVTTRVARQAALQGVRRPPTAPAALDAAPAAAR